MRLLSTASAGLLLLALVGFFSCDDHHHDDVFVDDVTVDITGDAGTDFDALFEDDDHSQTATGVVPFSADFVDQVNFLHAVVDKTSSGAEKICVRVTSSDQSKESCSTDANARVTVTVVF